MIIPLGPPIISPCFCCRLCGRSLAGGDRRSLGNPLHPSLRVLLWLLIVKFILVVDVVVAGLTIIEVVIAVVIVIYHCRSHCN